MHIYPYIILFVIICPLGILLEYDHFNFSHRGYAVPGTVESLVLKRLTGWGFPLQAVSHNATPECQPKTHPLPDCILVLAQPLYSYSRALPPLCPGHTHLICLVSLGGLMSSNRLCCPIPGKKDRGRVRQSFKACLCSDSKHTGNRVQLYSGFQKLTWEFPL